MTEPAFRLRGVEVRYGARTALDGVDLAVAAGEHVAVIGPSGAGKSTLIGLLGGTVAPTAGTVHVLGVDLAAAGPRARRAVQRRVGTVYQQFHLVGELRVVHNVNAGRLGSWSLLRSVVSLVSPRETDDARAALAAVGLADRLRQRTSSLSGGEQQRVAIARVLRQAPDAVLADEPVASLDPARGAEIVALLHEVCTAADATLLASLHDVDLALGRAAPGRRDGGRFSRVVGLRSGRVAFDLAPDAVAPDAIAELYRLDERASAPPETGAAPGHRGC